MATAADAQCVTDCIGRSFSHYIERIGKPPGPMLRNYGDLIAGGRVQVACVDDTIVGLLVTSRDETGFSLDVVAIDPRYQGRGIGRHLIRLAESQASSQGHRAIHLCTNVRMTENQALYSRLGYEEYARRQEDGYDRVFYQKTLPPEAPVSRPDPAGTSLLPQSGHPLVHLRPIALDDLTQWASYLNVPAVYEDTSWNFPTAHDLAKHVWKPDTIERERTARLAIADRSTNCLIGTIGFHSFVPADGSAEVAYDLMPEFWGKGIATSVCGTVVEWGFARFSYTRVRAAVLKENIRSLRVLDKCGFSFTESSAGFRMVRGEPRTFLLFEKRAGTSR